MKIAQQKKSSIWINEAGDQVAYDMITKGERETEKVVYAIATAAQKVSNGLAKLKAFIAAKVLIAEQLFHSEYKGKKTEFKGNYTFYNYDWSIQVKVKVGRPIKFDDQLINEAKALLDDFLSEGISAKSLPLKKMVMDAFATSRGKMDVKKILALNRYADSITDYRYVEAMKLINKAIRRPNTATYYQVALRQPDGSYEGIKLSLSDF